MTFKTFLFDRLPANIFKALDSYKDNSGRGLLERYLEIFGDELDEDVVILIEELTSQVDPKLANQDYLNLISYTLGDVPDFLGVVATYRNLLATIMSIYKIKGTKRSYTLLFALLGFQITITETPVIDPLLYDNLVLFDSGNLFDSTCQNCSGYSINFTFTNGSCTNPASYTLTAANLAAIRKIIVFNEPINAYLETLTNSIRVCEELDGCLAEEATLSTLDYNNYDEALLFDNGVTFDNHILTSQVISESVC
jgi:hypothetical protein